MHDYPLSATQVAARSSTSFEEAQGAVYMAASARVMPLSAFAAKTGLGVGRCRSMAWRWGVCFEDYDPYAEPVCVEWCKVTEGWDLFLEGLVIGECRRNQGEYRARLFSQTSCARTDPRAAMRALSEELGALSANLPALLGAPVYACVRDAEGHLDTVLFGDAESADVKRCRAALDFETHTPSSERARKVAA